MEFERSEMKKFIQLGKEFGLEGEKVLEFVREQEEKEEKRRKEEREEKNAERKNVKRNLGSLKEKKKRNVGS